ncbi:MAG: hypothetical protein IKD90_02480 [Clostridiales bacterium]|nr:hypothetical protein [Clostridiales bacterium]
MKTTDIKYYLIRGKTLAKREEGYNCFLFNDGKWDWDEKNVLLDRLVGYDPDEPDDSPYKTGSSCVMNEIEELTFEEAMRILNEKTIGFLIRKWKDDLAAVKTEWDEKPGWPAKLVTTSFILNGMKYTLVPEDLGLTDDCWDQGLMEKFQGEICKVLKKYGATSVVNSGFID